MKKDADASKDHYLKSSKLHNFYNGKIEIASKCCIRDFNDFAFWYTPGVAEPCRLISKNREAVFDNTNKGNSVAIVSDGSRVLGLGDIGPEASLPAMEGKALLFKFLGGVDAYPLCLGTKKQEDIINAVKWIQPSFSGINLEDINAPKCFYILDKLRRETTIPVWHDDQQGTATITIAGLINALKFVNKNVRDVDIAFIGAGAANIATSRLLEQIGANKEKMVFCDSKGILNARRKDLEFDKYNNPLKWKLCLETNKDGIEGKKREAMKGSDVVIAASKPGPGTILISDVEGMNDDAIVFALANPTPEIWPWEAYNAGAKIVATGRSDFPNQINNSLVFPAMFRGALDVRAANITDEMCIVAATELARIAEEKGLTKEYIIPKMDEWEVYPREAVEVGLKAIKQGVARLNCSWEELIEKSYSIIKKARGETYMLMKKGFIAAPPKESFLFDKKSLKEVAK